MIEELKLLIPLLQSAGEGAFILAIVMIVASVLKVIVPFGLVVMAVYKIAEFITSRMRVLSSEHRAARDIVVRVSQMGLCDRDGDIFGDHRRTWEALQEALDVLRLKKAAEEAEVLERQRQERAEAHERHVQMMSMSLDPSAMRGSKG